MSALRPSSKGRTVPIYGGSLTETQLRQLRRGVDVVVAIPGSALDHIRRKSLGSPRHHHQGEARSGAVRPRTGLRRTEPRFLPQRPDGFLSCSSVCVARWTVRDRPR